MPKYDLVCIGNAIVDMLAPVSVDVITSLGSPIGGMVLVSTQEAAKIEQLLGEKQEMGGGSAANTAVVAHLMGSQVAFLGKVGADQAGTSYAEDMCRQGIFFPSKPVASVELATGRCFVLITPDGQRTMHTSLGISTEFDVDDLNEEVIRGSKMTYLEGYLFDKPKAQAAFAHAAKLARNAGRQVALTLSDQFCVLRHRDAFRHFISDGVDVLFANDTEICALFETDYLDEALKAVAAQAPLAVVTRGEKGASVIERGQLVDVPTAPVRAIDTTGAGDAFAGGVLASLGRNASILEAIKEGHRAAGVVIAQVGARPPSTFR